MSNYLPTTTTRTSNTTNGITADATVDSAATADAAIANQNDTDDNHVNNNDNDDVDVNVNVDNDDDTTTKTTYLIAGAGIVGLSTAYYLAKNHNQKSMIIEWTGQIAPGASGKAAGFLVRDWNDGTPTQDLTRRSFDLHQELATTFGPETIQYRRLSSCIAVTQIEQQQQQQQQLDDDDDDSRDDEKEDMDDETTDFVSKKRSTKTKKRQKRHKRKTTTNKKKKKPTITTQSNNGILEPKNDDGVALQWLDRKKLPITSIQDMGNHNTIAQVTPKLLCQQLWKAVSDSGHCKLVHGKVLGAVHDDHGNFVGARVATANNDDDGDDDGDDDSQQQTQKNDDDNSSNSNNKKTDIVIHHGKALVYACGPWSANIMYGIKGHAITLPTNQLLNQVIFFYNETSIDTTSCEVFVRPNHTAFCTALPSEMVKVTDDEIPGKEAIQEEIIQGILQAVQKNCTGKNYNNKNKTKTVINNKNDDDDDHNNNNNDDDFINFQQGPTHQSACYQPVTKDFLPVIGPLSKRATGGGGNGCYMASGNNCWGILLGPVTGECMADLLVVGDNYTDNNDTTRNTSGFSSGKTTTGTNTQRRKNNNIDLTPFRPSRFRNLKPLG